MYKEYKLFACMTIETKPELRQIITDEILDAIVNVVEKYDSFVGGGINLEEYKDDE